LRAILETHDKAVDVAVGVSGEWVAQVRDPGDSGRSFHGGPDQMNRPGRRRCQHYVDLFLAHNLDRGRDRREQPRGVLVGNDQTASEELSATGEPPASLDLAELLGRSTPAGPEIARPVHPNRGRRLELFIAVQPAWIIGSENMRFDSEIWELCRELQRSLHPNTARRGEVKTDD
jgi:hypothetical protein